MAMALTSSGMTAITSSNVPIQHTDDIIRCLRCGYGGCDVRVVECGCSMHARCCPLPTQIPISQCPNCSRPASGLSLYPMNFYEIDNARRAAASLAISGKRGKKRKEAGGVPGGDQSTSFEQGDSDCRTGRWTTEEMSFCDKLIERFKAGSLPIVDGVKLNDFLANMLKSKQSRLTKKMKNANLSSKTFKRTTGYISDLVQCREFSEVEDAFFHSISDQQERADVRFHMQKEWREMFSSFCVSIGQPLDADAWLSSVEEMDRRSSLAKDAARMARRKMMMGYALNQDAKNPDQGVFIDRLSSGQNQAADILDNSVNSEVELDDFLPILNDTGFLNGNGNGNGLVNSGGGRVRQSKRQCEHKHGWHYASPFLGKIIAFLQRQGAPFEHVDAWVPSFVPNGEASEGSGSNSGSNCRLCFAGAATSEVQMPSDNSGPAQLLTQDEQFNLLSFGDYSQKFSFNVGCGLPGRVYESGVPTWEQSVHNAPHHHFERCGGAIQWGIKTVVGIPVPSPNVGRIVVVLYSRHDRNKDQELVGRLCDEFTKLMPSPKWKLVVDIGKTNKATTQAGNQTPNGNETNTTSGDNLNDSKDSRLDDLVSLLGEHMPNDQSSPFASYLPGFMSLRLMLLKPRRTKEEEEFTSTLLSSFSSYSSTGRARSDIAVMLARDFMFLKQQSDAMNQNNVGQRVFNGASSVGIDHSSFNAGSSYIGNNSMMMNRQVPQQIGVMGVTSGTMSSNPLNQNNSLVQNNSPTGQYNSPALMSNNVSNGVSNGLPNTQIRSHSSSHLQQQSQQRGHK